MLTVRVKAQIPGSRLKPVPAVPEMTQAIGAKPDGTLVTYPTKLHGESDGNTLILKAVTAEAKEEK